MVVQARDGQGAVLHLMETDTPLQHFCIVAFSDGKPETTTAFAVASFS
jgi:hypothetical protein